MLPKNLSRFRVPQRQTAQTTMFPAPTAGINAVGNLAQMQLGDCIFSYNMIPAQYGMQTREGYSEWATDVGNDEIRTIIPYVGSNSAEDRLFACTEEGIYDVSSGGSSPSLEISFASTSVVSGVGNWTVFVNTAGDYFCLYTDEENGYYVYTESSGTWAKIAMGAGATQIDNVDPDTLVSVMVWKNRVWFVERNSGRAWYLSTGALYGAATAFNFGNKFKYGGSLVAQYNWSVDGGEGVDDYLVSISTGGDVLVYKGTDPSAAATFDQRGSYFIGPPPAGRRIAGSFGGDLYLLSSYGVIPITKLLSGQLVEQRSIYVTQRITPLINSEMRLTRDELGWEIRMVPTQNLLLISTPKRESAPYLQFVQNLDTQGWAIYRDFPYFTGDTWQGNFYFGAATNVVQVHTGGLDGVTLADPEDSGEEVEFSMLTSFQDFQLAGANKTGQLIRTTFIGAVTPSYVAQARYDYDALEITDAATGGSGEGTLWDVGLWDAALWEGDYITTNKLTGTYGTGRSVAIALRGSSRAQVTLVRLDITLIFGNVL